MDDAALDSFLKLADNLSELEVTLGERARPMVAEVRRGLLDAVACRRRGDLPGALALLRSAMERLAAMGIASDSEQAAPTRMVARRFAEALRPGGKGAVKDTVDVIRHKTGGPQDEDSNS